MGSHRASRVAEEIKREASQIISEELKDPRLGFVTVTDVKLSNDLQHAKIYVSIMGSEEEEEKTLYVLEKANGFVRTEIGRRVRTRFVPEIVFKLDKSLDRSARISELLSRVRQEEE